MTTNRIAICSCSPGRAFAGYNLETKLRAIAAAGFTGVELFVEDLEWFAHLRSERSELPFASSFTGKPVNLPSQDEIKQAAVAWKELCDQLGLETITVQPLQYFEGNLDDSVHAAKFAEAAFLLDLCSIVGASILQVTSHYNKSGTTPDVKEDMRALADLAHQKGVRVAFEGISWAAYADTWQKAWEVVKEVDHPALGLLIDTYHVLGRSWFDCTSSTSLLPDASSTLSATLAELARSVPVEKIVYLQLSDVLRPDAPMNEKHRYWDDKLSGPLHMFSRNGGRVYPGEGFGLKEVAECTKTLLDMGFKGWVSIETFGEDVKTRGATTVEDQSRRAMISWAKVKELVQSS